jgi:hypothetical protein
MSAVRRAVLLAWRLHRAELVAVSAASLAISIIWLKTAADLDAVRAQCAIIGPAVAPCGGLREAGMLYTEASQSVALMFGPMAAALPFVAGVVLGVPLAARELEHRTLHLAWPLARSRVRWLALHTLPVVALGGLVLIPAALAGEVLTRSFYPMTDPAANFEHYGIRGPLLLLRFIPAMLVGALVGLTIGRQLPALLVAGILVAGLGAGLSVLRPFGAQPIERAPAERPMDSLGSMYVGVVYRDADGNVMAAEDAWALMAGTEEEPDRSQLPHETFLVIPGERLSEVVAREACVIGLSSAGLVAMLIALARRRRPS